MSAEKEIQHRRKESEPNPKKSAERLDCSPSSAFPYKKENTEEKEDTDVAAALELYQHLNETDRLLVLERMKALLENEK